MKKRTLFSKIPAVSAHESERISWASQLSLQTLAQNGCMDYEFYFWFLPHDLIFKEIKVSLLNDN